jgi:hypothetical protein
MNKLFWSSLFCGSFLLTPWGFAQDSDQSSSNSGVLVSSPVHADVLDQDSTGNEVSSDAPINDDSSQNTIGNDSDSGKTSNSSTDEIIDKSTNLVMSQITENMKLTQDQISAIRPIIKDNIVKVRDLQLSLEKGNIDAKAMYNQKLQAINDENQKLSLIFSPDQMKVWINIQNE